VGSVPSYCAAGFESFYGRPETHRVICRVHIDCLGG
jgi:hypothetical protein